MKHLSSSDIAVPESFDLALLKAALGKHGWRISGGRRGLYDRWSTNDDPSIQVIVPLDSSRPDYRELLQEMIDALAASSLESAQRVLRNIAMTPSDELRFCKEAATIVGAIPWRVGEDLIAAARETLTASAKAAGDRRPYFGNVNSGFARDFLDAVLMGQTDEGSYVVTAYAPSQQIFPEPGASSKPAGARIVKYTGRHVVDVMTKALQATRSALDHYTRTKSLGEFDEAVQYGVSRELTVAIQKLVKRSDGASVAIHWTPHEDDLRLEAEQDRSPVEIEFKPSDHPTLERAAIRLGKVLERVHVEVVGMVEILTRPVGKVGVVALNVISGSNAKKIRVRLPVESYEIALEAHRQENAIRVTGWQEREGNNYYWMYDPGPVSIVPIRRTVSQLNLFDETQH